MNRISYCLRHSFCFHFKNLIFVFILFERQKERGRQRKRDFPPTGSLPQFPAIARDEYKAVARSLELRLVSSCRQQRPKCLSRHLGPTSMHVNKSLNWRRSSWVCPGLLICDVAVASGNLGSYPKSPLFFLYFHMCVLGLYLVVNVVFDFMKYSSFYIIKLWRINEMMRSD